jgi:cell wall-associated NlpC family hydrolase
MNYSKEMVNYALRFISQPYQWGKQGPCFWDCSGFILEILKAFGRVSGKDDMTAKFLFRFLINKKWKAGYQQGSILFFGKDLASISHVGIAYNKELYISACSGDSTTTTLDRAIEQNAFIKIRPVRDDLIASLFHPEDIVDALSSFTIKDVLAA